MKLWMLLLACLLVEGVALDIVWAENSHCSDMNGKNSPGGSTVWTR